MNRVSIFIAERMFTQPSAASLSDIVDMLYVLKRKRIQEQHRKEEACQTLALTYNRGTDASNSTHFGNQRTEEKIFTINQQQNDIDPNMESLKNVTESVTDVGFQGECYRECTEKVTDDGEGTFRKT